MQGSAEENIVFFSFSKTAPVPTKPEKHPCGVAAAAAQRSLLPNAYLHA